MSRDLSSLKSPASCWVSRCQFLIEIALCSNTRLPNHDNLPAALCSNTSADLAHSFRPCNVDIQCSQTCVPTWFAQRTKISPNGRWFNLNLFEFSLCIHETMIVPYIEEHQFRYFSTQRIRSHTQTHTHQTVSASKLRIYRSLPAPNKFEIAMHPPVVWKKSKSTSTMHCDRIRSRVECTGIHYP